MFTNKFARCVCAVAMLPSLLPQHFVLAQTTTRESAGSGKAENARKSADADRFSPAITVSTTGSSTQMTFSVQHRNLTFRNDTGEAVAVFDITISGPTQLAFSKKLTVRGLNEVKGDPAAMREFMDVSSAVSHTIQLRPGHYDAIGKCTDINGVARVMLWHGSFDVGGDGQTQADSATRATATTQTAPQPKASTAKTAQAAGLPETMKFMQDSINGNNVLKYRIEFVNSNGDRQDHDFERGALVSADANACHIEFSYVFPGQPQVGKFGLVVSDVDDVGVMLRSDFVNKQNHARNPTGKSEILRDTPQVFLLYLTTHGPITNKTAEPNLAFFDFFDEDLAYRVASAVRHAARLCGAKGGFEAQSDTDFREPHRTTVAGAKNPFLTAGGADGGSGASSVKGDAGSQPQATSLLGDWVCTDQGLYHGGADTRWVDDSMWTFREDGTIHIVKDFREDNTHWREGNGIQVDWGLFSDELTNPSQTTLTLQSQGPESMSSDYYVTGSRGGEYMRGNLTCARGNWKTADVGRRWRFFNNSTRELWFHVNDGEATATGSSCDTNRTIFDGVLKPGDELVELCHGRDGFCVSFSERDKYPGSRSPWVGAACKGSEPFWQQSNNYREMGLP
jgi:hypothetical protein